jgi:hypothetical protein
MFGPKDLTQKFVGKFLRARPKFPSPARGDVLWPMA